MLPIYIPKIDIIIISVSSYDKYKIVLYFVLNIFTDIHLCTKTLFKSENESK